MRGAVDLVEQCIIYFCDKILNDSMLDLSSILCSTILLYGNYKSLFSWGWGWGWQVAGLVNNNKPCVIPQVGFGEDGMYTVLSPTL